MLWHRFGRSAFFGSKGGKGIAIGHYWDGSAIKFIRWPVATLVIHTILIISAILAISSLLFVFVPTAFIAITPPATPTSPALAWRTTGWITLILEWCFH